MFKRLIRVSMYKGKLRLGVITIMANKATGAGIGSGNLSSTKKGRPPKPKEVEGEGLVDAGKELVKKRKNTSSPVIGDNGLKVKPGDNAQYLRQGLEVMNLPPINHANDEEVIGRIDEY